MKAKKTVKLIQNNGYYLPLFNLNGMKSTITPFFAGDLKTDYHHYAIAPISELGLYHLSNQRNVIFKVNQKTYYLNGQTENQQNDQVTYSIKGLTQKVVRQNRLFSLVTTSYVATKHNLEVHQIVLTNKTNKTIDIDLTTAVPIYGRSADNLHDHRHVTSLLQQIRVVEQGILVQPTLSFDERGHQKNHHIYSVCATTNFKKANRYQPIYDDFIAGGSLQFPKGLTSSVEVGYQYQGYEAIGAIGFDHIKLPSQQSLELYLTIGIHEHEEQIMEHARYQTKDQFEAGYLEALELFESLNDYIDFSIESEARSNQLSYVTIQPILRRYFGNSYLPHHDYGHGGRGWRDLWQDLLALIMTNDPSVESLLIANFAGVRIDGSNATIIGDQIGEFKADRNQIVRVWSDHGAWPLLTTKMYIDETGNLDFILKKQTYFSDQFTHYTAKHRTIEKGTQLKHKESVYQGTLLEHLLLQNVVGHLNTGEKGFVKLEDADWNDGLDMAKKQGETVAFTHFYASNLLILAELIEKLSSQTIELIPSLYQLISGEISLTQYFDDVSDFNQNAEQYPKEPIILKLRKLAKERIEHLGKAAWIGTHYQSYVNNDGVFADQSNTMNLTGQTMALLAQTATPEQAGKLAEKTKELLYDSGVGGYRLNSNYQEILTNMGRAFGFAYGHKENGAVFSHMAIMYAYGLYQYNLVDDAHQAVFTLLQRAEHPDSNVLAGIPEYFNDRGIGKYIYLTGSASWLVKLLRTQTFGIEMDYGVLQLKPKLKDTDFIDDKASISTYLFGTKRTITYFNPKGLDYPNYAVSKIYIDGIETTKRVFTELTGNVEVHVDEIV